MIIHLDKSCDELGIIDTTVVKTLTKRSEFPIRIRIDFRTRTERDNFNKKIKTDCCSNLYLFEFDDLIGKFIIKECEVMCTGDTYQFCDNPLTYPALYDITKPLLGRKYERTM